MEVKNSQAYTLDDVARELGVSKTTVSRAISGKGRISAQTRQRVQDFIRSHGFRPNAVAKSLAQSRTHNLALVLPGGSALDFGFFQACVPGICAVASQNDCDVLLSMDGGQLERVLANRKVDGVILARSETDSPTVEILKQAGLPFVVIGELSDPSVVFVDNDNRGACRALTERLLASGMNCAALLGGEETHCVTHSRREGFLDAYRAADRPWERELIFTDLTDSSSISAAVDTALQKGSDCIVCMDDFICNLALSRLRERGVSVPGDVRVACFYDSTLLEHIVPAVTSLRFDAGELGKTACRTLLEMLEGGEGRSHILPYYRLMIRESAL